MAAEDYMPADFGEEEEDPDGVYMEDVFAAIRDEPLVSRPPFRAKTKPSGPGPCPLCKTETVPRNGKNGPFYGCPKYPHCFGTRDAEPVATAEEIVKSKAKALSGQPIKIQVSRVDLDRLIVDLNSVIKRLKALRG